MMMQREINEKIWIIWYTSSSYIGYEIKDAIRFAKRKIDEEYNELMKLIEYYREVLSSERLVFDIIKKN